MKQTRSVLINPLTVTLNPKIYSSYYNYLKKLKSRNFGCHEDQSKIIYHKNY